MISAGADCRPAARPGYWSRRIAGSPDNQPRHAVYALWKLNIEGLTAIKNGDKKVTKKTQTQYKKILEFMEKDKEYGIQDFCALLNLKESRTKVILNELSEQVETIGSNRDRRYKLK